MGGHAAVVISAGRDWEDVTVQTPQNRGNRRFTEPVKGSQRGGAQILT